MQVAEILILSRHTGISFADLLNSNTYERRLLVEALKTLNHDHRSTP